MLRTRKSGTNNVTSLPSDVINNVNVITSSFIERCRRLFGNSVKNGLLFVKIFGGENKEKGCKKKKKKDKKENKRENSGKKSKSPRKDEFPNQRETKKGVSFEINFRPATAKPPPPRRHKFVESLKSAQEKAIMANLRRMEEMVRKGEAAKQADRRREICLEHKAEQDRVFREKAQQALNKKVLPDQAEVSANMAILAKRCKTARRRQKIVDVFKGIKGDKSSGEGAVPSPALE